MSEAVDQVPPVVCTLTLGRRAEQELEWADLAPLAVSSRRLENGVISTYPIELADRIEDLANRELSCCGSWLDIEHKRHPDEFELRLTTANPEGVEVIQSFSPTH